MAIRVDLSGLKFGILTVTDNYIVTESGKTKWLCQCECGNQKYVDGYKLSRGITKSCGCASAYYISVSKLFRTESEKRLFNIWSLMKKRCRPDYFQKKYYFEKGIKVCDEWDNSFESFRDWAYANGYSEELTIDRIDGNGNYEPSNCRWADKQTQSENRSNIVETTYHGERICAARLARKLNVSRSICKNRILKGMSGDEIEKELKNGRRKE